MNLVFLTLSPEAALRAPRMMSPWWDEADGSEPENEIARASKPSAVEGEYDMGSAACLVPPQAAAENTATADWHGWQLRVGPPFMMNCC